MKDVGEPLTLHWGCFSGCLFGVSLRQPENGFSALWLTLGVVFAMRLVPTGHLLFFASPKMRTCIRHLHGCFCIH